MNDTLPPDLSEVPTKELLAFKCLGTWSNDPSDIQFLKACSDELDRRKQEETSESSNSN